jgi:hypothetical protein
MLGGCLELAVDPHLHTDQDLQRGLDQINFSFQIGTVIFFLPDHKLVPERPEITFFSPDPAMELISDPDWNPACF